MNPVMRDHFSRLDHLLPYYLTITCGGCGNVTQPLLPELMMRVGYRTSFAHLLAVLTCSRCGGQAVEIAVSLEEIRGQPKGPLHITEAPMCGRYKFTRSVDEVRQLFLFNERPNLEPRYNVGPGQLVPVVRLNERGDRELAMLKWGLIPSWAKDQRIGFSNINARRETADTKPAFRDAYKKRRCLLPADGFYEWEVLEDGSKQPWLFTLPDDGLFAIGGLWEEWRDADGRPLQTCTILTQSPYPSVKLVHDRSPVIIKPEEFDRWLSPATKLDDLIWAGRSFDMKELPGRRVSKFVNNVRNEGPECIDGIIPATSHGQAG
ncbi:MAG: SOS response-associated peptidase [Rhodospirillaceae bacterium]|nr:MAG: SOS response-associated peptidase [Rhodospirillaceae bacterium]